jgi:hypothetical protein
MIREINGYKQEKDHEEKEPPATKSKQPLVEQRVDQLYLFAV